MKKIFILGLVILAASFMGGCGKKTTVAEVGKPAPDFTLVDRKGKTWTLADLKGQVVFVNFWATWCPPCLEEMPAMQRLYSKMPPEKFKMLAILNNDKPEFADTLIAKQKYTFPVLTDPKGTTLAAYGLTGVPETYIVDKQGVLREKFLGPMPWDSPGAIQMLMKYINQ